MVNAKTKSAKNEQFLKWAKRVGNPQWFWKAQDMKEATNSKKCKLKIQTAANR